MSSGDNQMFFMPFQVSGTVIKGLGIGKKLGFPTLNLNPARAPKNLKFGVYVVEVKTSAGDFDGVLHFGPRPTIFAPVSLEIYCIGLKKNLYGKKIKVFIKRRLRAVKKFKNAEELKRQIKKDISVIANDRRE